jgi:hypothetical protein
MPPPITDSSTLPPVTIPHQLLPTLEILRRHIAELSRDNASLRYTLLGQPYTRGSGLSPRADVRAGSSRANASASTETGLLSLNQVSISSRNLGGTVGETQRGREVVQGVDLEKVVARVKAIMLENEELGEMVLEAGKYEGMDEELQLALEGESYTQPSWAS